jgi:hypothetical protein
MHAPDPLSNEVGPGARNDFDRWKALKFTPSEAQPERELNHARAAIRSHSSKQRIHLLPGRIELRCRVHGRPLRMIESVVELASKLESHLFADDEILECREIPLVLSRPAIRKTGCIANVSERRQREHAGIEPLLQAPCSVARFGFPDTSMRCPSPPPMRSTPVVVEKVIAEGAPLASVVVPEMFQWPKRVLSTGLSM